ncbi:MAG TPA: type II toxin-antitoxin system prevent-host-death family antitoxin [Caldilineaceae bacterium]|nr:type II toxin-antitoxin system prevent-host-death family antitoxin [Caldilineaceae bacterium]
MQTKILSSDQARSAWGEVLDDVIAGNAVSVQRHGRPVAVIVNAKRYERFQQWEAELARRTRQRYQEMRNDPTLVVDEEQYQKLLQAEGLRA